MAKHATPLLDQLESGPWPSFVSDIKQEAAYRAQNPKGLDYQIPVDCPEDLLGVLELSYNEMETHWKHGGIVGVFGYGGGVIGRYCDQPEMFPGVAHFHTMRVAQPSGKYYHSKFLRDLCDIWDLRGSGLTKKELLLLEREKDKLEKQLGGIRNMVRTPSAMFVVDINKESLAVEEAHKLGIPVVAIVDTNADPESVEYPIAANDDAIRGIELLTSLMADAVAEGLLERSGKAAKAEGEAEQPMAAWEKELLTEGAPAAEAPAEAEGETKAE